MTDGKLHIVPIYQAEANAFVKKYHRHHGRVTGSIFQIALADDQNEIQGVAIIGRPSSRHLDNGWTLEVTRLCTKGAKNACSMLYSAAWRVARNMGYTSLITYILKEERGTSLYASNWKLIGECGGGTWNRKDRPRVDKHSTQKKLLFEIS